MRQLPSGDVSHADSMKPGAHATLDKESNWQVRLSSSVSLNQAGLLFKTCRPASMCDCIQCGDERKWPVRIDADVVKEACELYDWGGEGQLDLFLLRNVMQYLGMNVSKEFCINLGQPNEEFEKFADFDEVVQKVQAAMNTADFKKWNNISKEFGRGVEDGFLRETEDEEDLKIVKVIGGIEAMDTSQDF